MFEGFTKNGVQRPGIAAGGILAFRLPGTDAKLNIKS